MKKVLFSTLIVAVCMLAFTSARGRAANAERRPQREFRADLQRPNEVPLTLSPAPGEVRLTISEDENSVHFVLSYNSLQTPVSFACIHVDQQNVNESVAIFFCGGGDRPDCPQEGTIEGEFTAADVLGLPSQQLDAHDLPTLLRAIRGGETYANVHTMKNPEGEIRGLIRGLD